jgi:uncharacterized membrane protein
MTTSFNFSIRRALAESWRIYVRHAVFFSCIALVLLILNVFARNSDHAWMRVLIAIVAIIWSYVWLSVSLAAVDGKEELLQVNKLERHLPSGRDFLKLIGIGIVTSIFIALGFIALIIPGFYFLCRLAFANLAFVDKKGSVIEPIRRSWHLVKGKIFWTVFLVMLIVLVLIVGGALLFVVGMLITYPIAMILHAKLYRALVAYHDAIPVSEEPKVAEVVAQ